MNQVNIQRFQQTVNAIENNHTLGKTPVRVRLHWTGGVKNQLDVQKFPAFYTDEPAPLGGTFAAPNPVDYLVSAAAACFATGFAWQAAQVGVALESLEIAASARIDIAKLFGMEQGYGGLDQLVLKVRAKADADLAALQTFAQRSQAGSPVLNSLKTAATVEVEKI